MKQILVYSDNSIFDFGKIEKGKFGGTEELYKVTKIDGSESYAVLNGFTVYEVTEIPEDVEPFKWCYTHERGFYLNPNYSEPPITIEEKFEELKKLISDIHADNKISDDVYEVLNAIIEK